MGRSVLALGEFQTYQEGSVVLLDEVIQENQRPFVEEFVQGFPNMSGWEAVKSWPYFHLSGRGLG